MSDARDHRYQLFDALDPVTEAALRASIVKFGVLVPVVTDQHGNVIDGHHRMRLAEAEQVAYRTEVIEVESPEHATELALTLNADRRQLTRDQRREVVAHLRELGHSFRAIGNALGVSVATAHADASTVQDRTVAVPDRIVGLDGRSRPSKMPKRESGAKAQQKELFKDRNRRSATVDDARTMPDDPFEGLLWSITAIPSAMRHNDFHGIAVSEEQLNQIREARTALSRLLRMLTSVKQS
jgi:ParB-like chromosome segregation protein Spo0J